MEEEQSQLRREHKEKCREHDQMKRLCTKLKHDLELTKAELDERDKLITEHGLVIVSEEIEETNGDISMNSVGTPKKSLVKVENAKLLENAGDGTLGELFLLFRFYIYIFLLFMKNYTKTFILSNTFPLSIADIFNFNNFAHTDYNSDYRCKTLKVHKRKTGS